MQGIGKARWPLNQKVAGCLEHPTGPWSTRPMSDTKPTQISEPGSTTKRQLIANADSRTLSRAQFEAFSFSLEAPGMVRVTNGSYANPENHSYRVNVENGLPVACECPAFHYQDGLCKHCLACLIREPVLKAANGPIMTDGGSSCPHDHLTCEGIDSPKEFPELCFPCWDEWASNEDN